MKPIDSEDPRVTAYVLGELPEHESDELRRVAEDNPALQAALAETHALAELIRGGFGNESLELGEARREAIRRAGRSPAPENLVSIKSRRRDWLRPAALAAVAAGLVACVLWILQQIPVGENELVQEATEAEQREAVRMHILLSPTRRSARAIAGGITPLPRAPKDDAYAVLSEVPSEIVDEEYLALREIWQEDPEAFFAQVRSAAREVNLPTLGHMTSLPDNPFVSTEEEARSTVPIVSGTASYHLVERFIRNEKRLPPRNSIRAEELINQVSYPDDGDADLDGIKLGVEIVRCPWDRELVLMGVLLRNESQRVIAEDAVLQVEVEPEFVRSYRLIGYAGRKSSEGESTVSEGLSPGRSNYVLYQFRPSTSEAFSAQRVVARVSLSIENESNALIVPVTTPSRDWDAASNNLQTAVALATWGMVLRESPFGGALTHLHIKDFAQDALQGCDTSDLKRREALQLIIDSLPLFELEPEENEN
ncbi:MAG: von Willebrand factor type A domain-containing protein [Roseibacillus sp.]|nr:von Willebrand factor type A domain-containing protein [Roseibacillus sp.]